MAFVLTPLEAFYRQNKLGSQYILIEENTEKSNFKTDQNLIDYLN